MIWVEALEWPAWQKLVQWFAGHRAAGRITGVIEIALGAWIVGHAYKDISSR